ncbi:Hydroxymethylglutaryl-CoA synthase [archaeon HR01]|nr:Hydroxymethylglutaryl-CoA synthase [archaeon HR01]
MPRHVDSGIVGYGCYIPRYRIKASEIARVWGRDKAELPIKEKAVAAMDEDTITMSAEAARYAIWRAGIEPRQIGAIHIGTESKPYAVKPSGTIVAEILGIPPTTTSADLEFACKAGTEALHIVSSLVGSGRIKYGLAIGADTAQGRPNDALEFTAASGAAALLVGPPSSNNVANIEHSFSFVTDTPDFWRRSYERYPVHTGRFTGEPAYFYHTLSSARNILMENGYSVSDIDYFVFHQPNVKFPLTAAKVLGIPMSKVEPAIVAGEIGNTYAACSLIGLSKVLDIASPGQRILLTSYGSGAGSDSFILSVADGIVERRDKAPRYEQLLRRRVEIDYAIYLKNRDKVRV